MCVEDVNRSLEDGYVSSAFGTYLDLARGAGVEAASRVLGPEWESCGPPFIDGNVLTVQIS